ncbi:MAG: MFS transporter [archaeon]|nr:MFS transporter [archaeon]
MKLDVRGTVLLFAAITLVTFAIETLSYSDLRSVSAVSAVIGIIVLVFFIRTERKCPAPLLNLSMFRDWQFLSIFLCLMMVNMVFMGMLYLLPFYGEICLEMSSATVGLFLLISAAVTAVLGMPVAKLSDRKGRRGICVLAGLFAATGFGLQAVFTYDMNTAILSVSLVLMGVSWACVGGPMASRLVEHAGDERDMASSLTNEAYYIGGAVGTALTAMLFTLFSATDGIDIQNVSSEAFMNGFAPTAFIVMGISLLIALLSLIVKDSGKE